MTTRYFSLHNLSAYVLALALLLTLASCDTILQYPEGTGYDPAHPHGKVTLSIKTDLNFDFLGEYEYDFENPYNMQSPARAYAWMAAQARHHIRYILKAYDADDNSVRPVTLETFVFTSPIESSFQETLNMELLPGVYRLVMWADYVDFGSPDDKYYNTADFSEIILKGEDGHYGSNVYRDAFYGETTLKVNSAMGPDVHAEIELTRPMAKYTFISTDLDEFLDSEKTRHGVVAQEDAGRSPEEAQGAPQYAPPLSDYTVRMVYTQYMPSSFNAHTGKPVDSTQGVEYHSPIAIDDQGRAVLAFDHVFTNGAETSVSVAMEVLHRDGSVVARMPQFDVPLKRSHHTIVTGKFLTTKSGGEIGIKPDFDGEFNIVIQ